MWFNEAMVKAYKYPLFSLHWESAETHAGSKARLAREGNIWD
jgi:hypothetical protein